MGLHLPLPASASWLCPFPCPLSSQDAVASPLGLRLLSLLGLSLASACHERVGCTVSLASLPCSGGCCRLVLLSIRCSSSLPGPLKVGVGHFWVFACLVPQLAVAASHCCLWVPPFSARQEWNAVPHSCPCTAALEKAGLGPRPKKKRAEKARKITGTRLCCRAGRPRVAWWLPDVFPVSVGCPASLASLPCSVGCRRLALLSVGPAIFGETGVERRPSQLPLHCCPCPVSHVYRDFCLLRPLPLGWAAALVVVSVGVGQAMSPGPLLRGALRLLVSPCVVFKLRPESTC